MIKGETNPIYYKGFQEGRQQTLKDVLKILKRFKDDSIYSGRIVKFEIKNRLGVKGK